MKSDLNVRTALRDSAVHALAEQYYLQEKLDDDAPAYGDAHASSTPQHPNDVLALWERGKLNIAAPGIVQSIQGAIRSLFDIEIQEPTIVFLTKVSKFGTNIFETETWQIELSRNSKPYDEELIFKGDNKNKRKASGDPLGQPTSKRAFIGAETAEALKTMKELDWDGDEAPEQRRGNDESAELIQKRCDISVPENLPGTTGESALVTTSNPVGADDTFLTNSSDPNGSSDPQPSRLNNTAQQNSQNMPPQGEQSEIVADGDGISKLSSQVSDSLKNSLIISRWLRLQLEDEASLTIIQDWLPKFFKVGYFSQEEIKDMGKAARETLISPLQTRKFLSFPNFRKIEPLRGLNMNAEKMEACQCGCDSGHIASRSCAVPGCGCARWSSSIRRLLH